MRNWTKHSLFLLTAVLVTPIGPSITTAFAFDDAAHALAERFAGGTGNASETDDQRKTEEAEILARARTEAADREAEANRAAQSKLQADAAKAAQNAELDRQASEQAEAARLEADRLKADHQARAEAEIQDAARLAASAAAEAQLARENEVSDLAEKMKRVREARPTGAPTGAMGLGVPPQEPEALQPAPQHAVPATAAGHEDAIGLDERWGPDERLPSLPPASVRNATSVTVLLVMEPGTTGIRIGSKTADPVLCLDSWCYVSTGAQTAAKLMPRGAALGPINTLGLRAGACRQSLTCIYRGLDIAAYFKTGAKPGSMQPIDLRYLHHDRREAVPLMVDANCSVRPNKLSCATAIKGKGWSAWIVPEELAVEAGVEALQAALADGLSTSGTSRAASLKFNR